MTTAKPGNGVSEEGFLARWSHRKQQADSEESIAQADQPLAVAQDAAEPLPTDADMPPLDSLTEESDYSGFLSPKVSDELRKLALRKLFHSAAFNLTDGLDGLAIGPVVIAAATYMFFAYVAGHIKISEYLQINYVAGSGEVVFAGLGYYTERQSHHQRLQPTGDGGALTILTDESQQPAEFATMVWVGGSEFYSNSADGDGGAVYIRAHAVEGLGAGRAPRRLRPGAAADRRRAPQGRESLFGRRPVVGSRPGRGGPHHQHRAHGQPGRDRHPVDDALGSHARGRFGPAGGPLLRWLEGRRAHGLPWSRPGLVWCAQDREALSLVRTHTLGRLLMALPASGEPPLLMVEQWKTGHQLRVPLDMAKFQQT